MTRHQCLNECVGPSRRTSSCPRMELISGTRFQYLAEHSPWAALPLRPAAAAGRGPRISARAPRAPVVLGGCPPAPGALKGCPGPGLRDPRRQQQNDVDDERADATPPTPQPPVLRVAILLSYCSILCNYKAIEMPSHQTYGGSWKFLTFIDLVRPLPSPSPVLPSLRARVCLWVRRHLRACSSIHAGPRLFPSDCV